MLHTADGACSVALDELGPVVVNADCTVRRITNWDAKLPHEKVDTQRVVAARNAGRLEKCRALEAAGLLPVDTEAPIRDEL